MAAEDEVFEDGTHVVVRGLAKAAQYNDQPGIVQGPAEDGRYAVYLTKMDRNLRVKPVNLKRRQSFGDPAADGDSKEDVSSSSTRPTRLPPTPDLIVVAGAGLAEANSEYTLDSGDGHAGKSRWSSSEGWSLEWTELDGGTWWLCDPIIGRYAAASPLKVPPPSGWVTCNHVTVGADENYSIDETHGQDPTPTLTYPGSDGVAPALPRAHQPRPNGASKSSSSAKKAHARPIVPGTRGASVAGGNPSAKGKKRLKSEKRLKNILDRGGFDVSNFLDVYGALSNKVIENYIQMGKDGDFSFHLGSRRADYGPQVD